MVSIPKVMLRLVVLMPVLCLAPALTIADEPAKQEAEKAVASHENAAGDDLTEEALAAVAELKDRFPEGSEAIAMLDDILKGSQLGPEDGWFRLAHSQTRFSWDDVAARYDANNDQQISRNEFTGTDGDFSRVDRDHSGAWTKDDFDWSTHSLNPTPGFRMFFMADRDANGKLTREEFDAIFSALDTDQRGFLALDDLRNEFLPGTPRPNTRRPDSPGRSTLVMGLKRQEIGSLQPGPGLNDPAIDFTLTDLNGRVVTLSEQIGEQPVVLIFGNFTCGPFRSQSGNIEKLYERFRDRAKFFLVYVREAHPAEGWWMTSNQKVGIDISQPTTNEERVQVAETCQQRLDITMPMLVDTIDDTVGAAYSGMPNRLYLIDGNGRIAFKNGRGPFGFHPQQLEQSLILLLNQTETTKASSDATAADHDAN